MFSIAEHHFESNKIVSLYNKGVSNINSTLYLYTEKLGESRLVPNKVDGAEQLEVVSIDSVEECKNATFIKMDIEGAELDALEGAKQTILRNRPKLAICIYHSNEDMLRIIEYVHNMVPDYSLYVRHHSRAYNETVLYAVP